MGRRREPRGHWQQVQLRVHVQRGEHISALDRLPDLLRQSALPHQLRDGERRMAKVRHHVVRERLSHAQFLLAATLSTGVAQVEDTQEVRESQAPEPRRIGEPFDLPPRTFIQRLEQRRTGGRTWTSGKPSLRHGQRARERRRASHIADDANLEPADEILTTTSRRDPGVEIGQAGNDTLPAARTRLRQPSCGPGAIRVTMAVLELGNDHAASAPQVGPSIELRQVSSEQELGVNTFRRYRREVLHNHALEPAGGIEQSEHAADCPEHVELVARR